MRGTDLDAREGRRRGRKETTKVKWDVERKSSWRRGKKRERNSGKRIYKKKQESFGTGN